MLEISVLKVVDEVVAMIVDSVDVISEVVMVASGVDEAVLGGDVSVIAIVTTGVVEPSDIIELEIVVISSEVDSVDILVLPIVSSVEVAIVVVGSEVESVGVLVLNVVSSGVMTIVDVV